MLQPRARTSRSSATSLPGLGRGSVTPAAAGQLDAHSRCLRACFPWLRPSAAAMQCSPARLRGNGSTQHRSFPKPLTVYTMPDKNLDTSLSAAYCLGFLATTKSSLGFGQRSLRPCDMSSPEHFFLKATEVPYIQRVKASPPHLHLSTNPIFSNHRAPTYWWPCRRNCLTPPPSFHSIAPGSNLPHGLALRHSRKLLWVVSLDFSLC